MDEVYTKIKSLFEANNIPYKEIQHAPGASAEDYHNAVGCQYEQQAKCLLVRVKAEGGKYYAVVSIPAQKRLDLDQLKNKLNAKEIRMANKDELKEVIGCNFGEVPPLGSIFTIKLILDQELLSEEEVYMNAGKVDVSFVVNPKDIQKLENPVLF
jgi:Ala-tRNA(Pro) deacylase